MKLIKSAFCKSIRRNIANVYGKYMKIQILEQANNKKNPRLNTIAHLKGNKKKTQRKLARFLRNWNILETQRNIQQQDDIV